MKLKIASFNISCGFYVNNQSVDLFDKEKYIYYMLFAVMLAIAVLYDYRKTLNKENSTKNREYKFLLDDNCKHCDDASQGKASCVAHENLCGIGVVP